MTQIEHGLKKILQHPVLYNFLQWSLGATQARKEVVQNVAQPLPGMNILDIGCGPGTIIPYLPSSICYFGLDTNLKYIECAKKKFGPAYTFLHEDANNLNAFKKLPAFDLVFALGLLHHLEDHESSQLLECSAKALKKGGRLITLDGCYTSTQSGLAKYFLNQDRGQNIRTEEGYISLAKPYFKNIKATLSHTMLRIPYTLILMECS